MHFALGALLLRTDVTQNRVSAFRRPYLDCAYENGYGGIRPFQTSYFDHDGALKPAKLYDPDFVGQELPCVEGLQWTAFREAPKSEGLGEILALDTWLFLSPRAKELFEERGVKNIQYIPIKLFEHEAANDGNFEEWWYGHIHNWRQPFNLESSSLRCYDWPEKLFHSKRIEATFGPQGITGIERLQLNPSEVLDDVFLARVPNYQVWARVYFSSDFVRFLNERLRPGCTSRFELDFSKRPRPPAP